MEKNVYYSRRRGSFLSAVAWGLSLTVMTVLVCCTVLAISGMQVIGDRADHLGGLVERVVESVPEIRAALPPVLQDAINDRRDPGYIEQLAVSADIRKVPGLENHARPIVTVVNNGDETVSLLAVHVAVLTANDDLVYETTEYAATPLACDHDWRGPLLPGTKRRLPAHRQIRCQTVEPDDLRVEISVTDVRTWIQPTESSEPAAENGTGGADDADKADGTSET